MRAIKIISDLMSMSERSNYMSVCLTHEMLTLIAKDVKADEEDVKKLQAIVDRYYANVDGLGQQVVELRELTRDLWRFTSAACEKYPQLFDPPAQGGQMVQPNMLESFRQRMEELGIEVGK